MNNIIGFKSRMSLVAIGINIESLINKFFLLNEPRGLFPNLRLSLKRCNLYIPA